LSRYCWRWKGKLVKQGKFLGVPSYKDRQITEGSINHVINFGLKFNGFLCKSIESRGTLDGFSLCNEAKKSIIIVEQTDSL
jgi:hypothetical protein